MEDDPKISPATSKAGYKALLAKQYEAVYALTDGGDGDPEMQAYLARLEKAVKGDA